MNVLKNFQRTAMMVMAVTGISFNAQAPDQDPVKVSKGVAKETQKIIKESGTGLKFSGVEEYTTTSIFGAENTRYALVYEDDNLKCRINYSDENANRVLEPGEIVGVQTEQTDGKYVVKLHAENPFPQIVDENAERWTKEAYKTLIDAPLSDEIITEVMVSGDDSSVILNSEKVQSATVANILEKTKEIQKNFPAVIEQNLTLAGEAPGF